MLPLKLLRSLVLRDAINNPFLLTSQTHLPDNDKHKNLEIDTSHPHLFPLPPPLHHLRPHHNHTRSKTRIKTKAETEIPLLLFTPTKELVTDTYRLATLARDVGMDLFPNPSLSHIIFSWPPSSPSSPSSSSSYPSFWSSTPVSSSSSSWSLPNDAVPLPFPSLAVVSLSHLRRFVSLSRGFFKLVFLKSVTNPLIDGHQASNWDCCSVSLISRRSGERISSMDSFSRALAGMGWTLLKTKKDRSPDSVNGRVSGANSVFLFRKVDTNRVRTKQARGDGGNGSGQCRIRELRLPPLDFRNAPLRILQYILLMTDDIFYLA